MTDDRDLLQALKRRDRDAMLALYDRYGRLIYSIIYRAVNDSAMAEDLTQETFLRVWTRVGTFREEKGNLEGWLVTVARNRAFDYLRAVRKSQEMSVVDASECERAAWLASPEEQADRLAVTRALGALNPEQRAVIELTHFEGLTQSEIAGQLRKPLGTVKGLVRSALKTLRSAMGQAELQ